MINRRCCSVMLFALLVCIGQASLANDKPQSTINTAEIAVDVALHYLGYSHYEFYGMCLWRQHTIFGPIIFPTPEVSEYIPDLIVTVYDEPGDDPLLEARETLDPLAYTTGSVALKAVTRYQLANGQDSNIRGEMHNNSDVTKSVDVIGSPMSLMHIPFVMLSADTMPFVPYFQSDLDALPGRLGFAEDLEPDTWSPFGPYIGSGFYHHWAYEFPRSMSVDNDNDYKASVSIALHAADIVTNKNMLHVVLSTSDSCGQNCAVANIIPETKDDHEIWEEVYPHDKHIKLGESDLHKAKPLGSKDEKKGHGNYVFVVWRHYKGCVQASGHVIYAPVKVPPTKKR